MKEKKVSLFFIFAREENWNEEKNNILHESREAEMRAHFS